MNLKKKTIVVILIILLIIIGIIFFIFFKTRASKNLKIGNNSNSQEIVDYKDENESSQEILEPSNISGVKITKNSNQLKIENTNLNLSSLYENYEYVSDNILDLSDFIVNYKTDKNANWIEEKNQIVMQTEQEGKEKKLFIEKETKKPVKLQIEDRNKKVMIYISYNEINIK